MLGVALEGGGARCAAQAGVLAALCEKGLAPEAAAGCGGGAWVASLYALGLRAEGLKRLCRDMRQVGPWMLGTRLVGLQMLFRGRVPQQGLLSGKRMLRVLRWQTMDAQMRDARIPLAVAAWDMDSAEEQMFSSVLPEKPSSLSWNRQISMAQAVAASCAVPGLVRPLIWRGRPMTGGTTLWMALEDALRDLGATSVLHVRVATLRDGSTDAAAIALSAGLPRDMAGEPDAPNVLRVPLPARAGLLDFADCDRWFEAGYQACLHMLPRLALPLGRREGKVLPFAAKK